MKKIKEEKAVEKIEKVEKTETKTQRFNPKSLLFYIPLTLLVLLLVGGVVAYARYGSVALVNGHPISRLEYIKTLEKQGGKQVLSSMVQETLIKSEAAKKGVSVSQSEIDQELTTIEGRVKAQGYTLDQALQSQGMTKEDLISQIRSQKLIEKLVTVPTEVSQAQIDAFVTQNKDQFDKKATKQEMENTAKTQLLSQAKNDAINQWLSDAEKNAKIIYR